MRETDEEREKEGGGERERAFIVFSHHCGFQKQKKTVRETLHLYMECTLGWERGGAVCILCAYWKVGRGGGIIHRPQNGEVIIHTALNVHQVIGEW